MINVRLTQSLYNEKRDNKLTCVTQPLTVMARRKQTLATVHMKNVCRYSPISLDRHQRAGNDANFWGPLCIPAEGYPRY